MAIAVNDNEFEEKVLKSSTPVLVDFWAEWCGPCRQVAPVLDEISETHGDKITVAKVNIDDNPNTPQNHGVRGIPTMIIFKDGEPISTKVGALPKSKLVEWIDSVVA